MKAEKGDVTAQLELGLLYLNGSGVSPDYVKAAKWLQKPAETGDAKAQFGMGVFDESHGNSRQAALWYAKAARQGHKQAQENVARMKLEGLGFSQDVEEALKWYRRAAEEGDPNAQYHLANIYREGRYVRQDLVEAYAWFSICRVAPCGAYPPGEIENRMTRQEIAAARKRLAELRKSLHLDP